MRVLDRSKCCSRSDFFRSSGLRRDAGVAEADPSEACPVPKIFQSGVGDLRAAEVQMGQVGELWKVFQVGVGDLRRAEIQVIEDRQIPQSAQADAGDSDAGENQLTEVGQPFQIP